MKILRVISSMDPANGGPCQGIRNSIPALAAIGSANDVVCLDDPADDFVQEQGFLINAVGKFSGPWAYNKNLIPWLIKNMCNYDVVIVHGLWQYHSFAIFKAIRKIRSFGGEATPKVFIMPHGMLDPWFQRAKERRKKAWRNSLYWHLLESKNVQAADGLLFTCEEEMLLARTTFWGFKPKKELNAGYGIPAPPVYSQYMKDTFEEKIPAILNKKYLLFLSRIHPKKGVELLLEAYKQILREANEPNEIPLLVIAGPGLDTSYAKQCISFVKSNDVLHKRVFFPGMLTGDDKWGAIYGCEAFILPSHQENFGIAVVEAMACGKPVLISNQVNIYREIEAGGGGIIGTDNVVGVKNQLMTWLHKTSVGKEVMSKNAFDAYQRYFTVEAAAKQLIEAVSSTP